MNHAVFRRLIFVHCNMEKLKGRADAGFKAFGRRTSFGGRRLAVPQPPDLVRDQFLQVPEVAVVDTELKVHGMERLREH